MYWLYTGMLILQCVCVCVCMCVCVCVRVHVCVCCMHMASSRLGRTCDFLQWGQFGMQVVPIVGIL